MRTLVEVTYDEENKDGEVITKKSHYYLLHWGLKYDLFDDAGRILTPTYTVAICQDRETDQVRCFRPEQLKIIGDSIKK